MQAWEALWPVAFQQLANISGSILAAAIPLQNWFRDLLEQSEFICSHQVIVLAWRSAPTPKAWLVEGAKLRAMSLDDVSAVGQVDAEAFGSIWQNSLECIEIAFKQSAVATVCDIEGEIVGYQISTATPMGGHLARLAVKPAFQKRGIGHALAADLVSQFARRGAQSVTVNTQSNNLVSLSLYESIGFQKTGEEYPVYEQPIK
jgi:ribosomal-protein-alanine N-acetyltransferase